MNLVFIFPLALAVIGFCFYFSYKLLSKINFNLNGTEILLFQLSFVGIFFGIYNNDYVNTRFLGEISIFVGVVLLVFLAFYYIVRMIKRKLYIKWQMYIVYIILLIIDAYSLNYIPMIGWDGLGYALLFLLLILGLFAFLLIINIITLIIRSVKKIKYKNTNDFNIKKELVISLMVVSLFLPIIYGINFSNKIKHEKLKREEVAKEQGMEYLNKKYGNGNFEIVGSENSDYDDDFTFVVNSKYLDDGFNLYIEDLEENDISDDLIFKYYSYKYNDDIYNYYDLKNHIEKKLDINIKNKYDIEIDYGNVYFDEESFEKTSFGKIPTMEDMVEFVEVDVEEVKINKVFTKDDSDEFCKYIINIYEELNYKEDILWFKFNYVNPYSASLHYKDGGYLRKAGEFWYDVYVDATPIKVKK